MDVNEELIKMEQLNSALSEAIINSDYATQYAVLKAFKGEKDEREQVE